MECDGLPSEMKTWIGERDPRNAQDVARWMQAYLTYHTHRPTHRHQSSSESTSARTKGGYMMSKEKAAGQARSKSYAGSTGGQGDMR